MLTAEALDFVAALQRRFGARREALLAARLERQRRLAAGQALDFLPSTRAVREGAWKVAPVPKDLQDRRVEITGPVDRKMMINALNSGARCFMADFEDALSPTWANVAEGQANLLEAAEGTLSLKTPEKEYKLQGRTAVLLVRPRGWHLQDKHVLVDGKPVSASLLDYGLFAFHSARPLLRKGSGPYVYLPKMESHLEARLWNEVFDFAEETLRLPPGCTKATVLIETLPAAFEMDEILHELRTHAAGLNAGRWDYLFSAIKTLRHQPRAWPDRGLLTMEVGFMRAYSELLVKTCHRRGAHAMGGMAAFIPNRRDAEVTERALRKVKEDKEREAAQGFDGTWVAHPDLVPVALEVFERVLGEAPNQVKRQRDDVGVGARELLALDVPGAITEEGLRANARVGMQYIEAWLRGQGAVAIDNLMEDAATAEIARAQVWQWVRHRAKLADGRPVTAELVRAVADEEHAKLLAQGEGRHKEARALFEAVALGEPFAEFLTVPAYDHLN